VWVLGALAVGVVAWACTLNPQPLPPGDEQTGGPGKDNGSENDPTAPRGDAAGSDAGDGGDAGDAADAADADNGDGG
jgi:hypothetical protein